MIKDIFPQKHICIEEQVTDYIDNRMTTTEKKEYIKKIENCLPERKCTHCKQLIIEFLTLKKNCLNLQSDYLMPKHLENSLISRIQKSFQRSKK